jgi:hypothetical protein
MFKFLRTSAILLAATGLHACDGPHEDAGERADARSGATGGASSIISGPAEKAGEQRDREEARQREKADHGRHH